MKTTASRQHGVTFSGLLVWIVVLIFVAISAMKLAPAYVQDAEIKSIFNAIVNDSEMQGASVKAIRDSYGKRAMINAISLVGQNDIEVEKSARGLVLSANYQVKIPLVGNASLVLEFNPSSSSK